MKCAVRCWVAWVAFALATWASPAQGTSRPEALFEELWDSYDRQYALFEAKRVDWNALYQIYRPRVTPQTTDDELFTLMAQLLGHLNDNHVILVADDLSRAFSAGYLGRYINEVGLAAAMELLATPPMPARYYTAPPRSRGGGHLLSGWVGPGIGYVHIAAFEDPEASGAAMDSILADFSGARGLIVDIRNDEGGDDRVGKVLADRFADRRRLYMVTRERIGAGREDFTPARYWHVEPGGAAQFTAPVILLQNRLAVSAGDNFALAMRVLPHVTSLGDFTSGCMADMRWQDLPNGWRYSISFNRFDDYAGRCWEGIGVPPDIMVREATSDGVTDPAFETALALLTTSPPAPQDESGSARAARVSLSAQFVREFEEQGLAGARDAYRARQRDLPRDSWFVDWDEMVTLAGRLIKEGRIDEGLAVYELHAETFPEFMLAHYWLGSALLRQGRVEPGLQAWDRALALNRRGHPREVRAFMDMTLRGSVYRAGVEGFQHAFQELCTEDPAAVRPEHLNEVGYALLGTGRTEEALAVLELNVERFPDYANGFDSLGEAYAADGQTQRAIQAYEKAIALDPEHGDHAREMLEGLRAGRSE